MRHAVDMHNMCIYRYSISYMSFDTLMTTYIFIYIIPRICSISFVFYVLHNIYIYMYIYLRLVIMVFFGWYGQHGHPPVRQDGAAKVATRQGARRECIGWVDKTYMKPPICQHCPHIFLCMYMSMDIYIMYNICIYKYIFTYIHIYIYTLDMYMYIDVYICIHVYV